MNNDITDAVGELIRAQKMKRKLDTRWKFFGWFMVVITMLGFFLLFKITQLH